MVFKTAISAARTKVARPGRSSDGSKKDPASKQQKSLDRNQQQQQQLQQQEQQQQAKKTQQYRRRDSDKVSESQQSEDDFDDDGSAPPFLPLEEEYYDDGFSLRNSEHADGSLVDMVLRFKPTTKQLVASWAALTFLILTWDATIRSPEDRWISLDTSEKFLTWVQGNPTQGILAILLVIAAAVVFMIPVGTPLTVGCGYIYKGAYGWKIGLTVATIVAMGGSALGAVTCFLLGRYLMRDQVRKWIKKYPLFDAIDVAAGEHGLRIMAMLYLTPILPLGPVSYMCGTTSMALSSFVLAKIASLPLMLLYAFIGASTGALLGRGKASQEELQKIEENQYLIVSGIILSMIMISCITHNIKKELNKILERQEKHKPGEMDQPTDGATSTEEAALEMGVTAPRQRRNV